MADPTDEMINDITGIERREKPDGTFICEGVRRVGARQGGDLFAFLFCEEGWAEPQAGFHIRSFNRTAYEVGKRYELFLRPEVKS